MLNIVKKVILIQDRLEVMETLDILNSQYSIGEINKKLSDQLTIEYLNRLLVGDPHSTILMLKTNHSVRYHDKYDVNLRFKINHVVWRDCDEDIPIITLKLETFDAWEGPAFGGNLN